MDFRASRNSLCFAKMVRTLKSTCATGVGSKNGNDKKSQLEKHKEGGPRDELGNHESQKIMSAICC